MRTVAGKQNRDPVQVPSPGEPTALSPVSCCLTQTALLVAALLACPLALPAADPPPQQTGSPNRLIRESSPYLLLHAHNPVQWYPWGQEALDAAVRENKPIFLSVGYSSCFWCHVMERQVFSNKEIAAYMNQHFINVKVDREERPDIDEVYMLSLQVYQQLAGSTEAGGWPLSLFLTPSGHPIAGGTYFPPEDQPGRPGFLSVAGQIVKAWTTREKDVLATAAMIAREVQRLSHPPMDQPSAALEESLVTMTIEAVMQSFDPEHGGFGFDPSHPDEAKFPNSTQVELLQSRIGLPGTDTQVGPAVDLTLKKIAAGGLRDHLGGGFHRYCVDRTWRVPHFEKMLYDNAQLADLYVTAYRRTGLEAYRRVAEETFDFVLTEMRDSAGSFHSAFDAETEGVEGRHYVWSRAELQQRLSAGDYRIFATGYGLDEAADPTVGQIVWLPRPLEETASKLGMPVSELVTRLQEIRERLLTARRTRPAPLKDDKILTSWNGLMIKALAHGGQTLKRRDYLDAAERAALAIMATHRSQEGRLLHGSRGGRMQGPGFLDDYAFFVSGLLALHDVTGEDKWLSAAKRLTDDQISLFWDRERGGFFFTGIDQDAVLVRSKTAYDNVLPSGNSVTARNLVQLSRKIGESTYRRYAEQTLTAFAAQLKESPANLPELAIAISEYLHWYGALPTQSAGEKLFASEQPARPQQPLAQAPTSPPPAATTPATPPAAASTPAAPVPALRSQPAPLLKEQYVSATGYLSVDKLPAGQSCRIAVELEIAPGWHINANPPDPDFVVPTALKLTAPSGVTLEAIQYPKGLRLNVGGFDEPLSVYEGKVTLLATLTAPEDLSGTQDLTLELQYQPCNDRNCLRPTSLKISGPVDVAPAKTVREINRELFEKLDASASKP